MPSIEIIIRCASRLGLRPAGSGCWLLAGLDHTPAQSASPAMRSGMVLILRFLVLGAERPAARQRCSGITVGSPDENSYESNLGRPGNGRPYGSFYSLTAL